MGQSLFSVAGIHELFITWLFRMRFGVLGWADLIIFLFFFCFCQRMGRGTVTTVLRNVADYFSLCFRRITHVSCVGLLALFFCNTCKKCCLGCVSVRVVEEMSVFFYGVRCGALVRSTSSSIIVFADDRSRHSAIILI